MAKDTQQEYITLTPAGVFEAFLSANPNPEQLALQSILSENTSVAVSEWLEQYSHAWLDKFVEQRLVELVPQQLSASKMALDEFLPHVVASLSGSRRAAIASNEGFCLARIGYSQEEAERLSVAGADFFDFFVRQEHRGLQIEGRAVSLFRQVDLLMPETSFIFLWIDAAGYVLILDSEPLTNNRAFVELIWAIKTSGLKFNHTT